MFDEQRTAGRDPMKSDEERESTGLRIIKEATQP